MKLKFFIAVVAAIAPLTLCQDLLQNGQSPFVLGQMNQLNGFSLSGSDSQAQAQAQAQSQSHSNSFQEQSNLGIANFNGSPLQSYLNALQTGPTANGSPAIAGVPVLSGLGIPGAASPLPAYNPYTNQDAIQESLAETNLAAKIRQGAVQVVPPNLSHQAVLQSMHVPVQGRYGNRVYATQPLPPMVVTQPGSPTIQISSGPAAEVRAAPVIYRQPPSIVYQNEIITRQPAPLSLNPVYVKVYKPGKQAVVPNVGSVGNYGSIGGIGSLGNIAGVGNGPAGTPCGCTGSF
ncbi:chorion protein S36 [Eupeodes corollae]|uniref:chorion protein S36 n=1 Tax=Eupeodes corollae TaxID=290404 RepID=UPI0024934480|nr:chorion protein S36 [Eupeodes corollae]